MLHFLENMTLLSMITRTPKPSTPQLEHEFTSALRDLERRQAVRMMAFSQSFQDLCNSRSTVTEETPMMVADQWSIDPQKDQNIQAFLDRFYTINLGTQLLIGKSSFLLTLNPPRSLFLFLPLSLPPFLLSTSAFASVPEGYSRIQMSRLT
jgi:hypothetical protein